MAGALETSQVGHEEFSAPHAAVGSIATSIPRHTDDPTIQAVVDQAARDVRVMMLDGHVLDAVERARIDGRAIRGVEVMSHNFRGQLEQPAKVADRLNVRAKGHLAREV